MRKYLLFVSKAYSFSILRPLQAAIRNRGDQAAWFIHGVDNYQLNSDEIVLNNVQAVKDYNPFAVFVPGNWVPDFFPGIKVQIFHGFGIEKKGHFRIRGSFDLYCTHGPATTAPFTQLAEKYGHFAVIETGWPKMDPLFKFLQEQGYDANRHQSGKSPQVEILFAPTFSPALTCANILFDRITELSRNKDWNWTVKFHPLMDSSTRQRYTNSQHKNLHVSDNEEILPLLLNADIMLTDTSSVVSEFLLLDKPVITFDTMEPGPHVYNITEPEKLEHAITEVISNPQQLLSGGRNFIAQMHPYNDGLSSERVLDATEQFANEFMGTLKPKPLNLLRKFRARKRLNYFHVFG